MDQNEPITYKEATLGSDSEKWLEAMKSEMQSIYDNQVWTLIDPPKGIRPLGMGGFSKRKPIWMAMCIPLRRD